MLSFFIIITICYSIAILIELTTILLIIDMGRWNTSIKLVFSMSVLDVLTFVFGILSDNFEFLYDHSFPKYNERYFNLSILLHGIELVFLCWSLTASLLMSYNVYHLLKFSKIFDFKRSREKWLFYLLLMLSIGIILPAVLLILNNSNMYLLDNDFLVFLTLSIGLPSTLVFANIVLFLLSRYHSNRILQPIQQMMTSSSRPDSQSAIAVLVKRMQFYPITQSVLLIVLLLTNYYFFFILVPLSALAYLVLFLKMQPFALDHLKYRLGLGGKPVNTAAKAQPQHSSTKTSNTTSLLSTSIVESQHDTDLVDYDRMEDDELSSIVKNASSIGSGNDVGNISDQSQL